MRLEQEINQELGNGRKKQEPHEFRCRHPNKNTLGTLHDVIRLREAMSVFHFAKPCPKYPISVGGQCCLAVGYLM